MSWSNNYDLDGTNNTPSNATSSTANMPHYSLVPSTGSKITFRRHPPTSTVTTNNYPASNQGPPQFLNGAVNSNQILNGYSASHPSTLPYATNGHLTSIPDRNNAYGTNVPATSVAPYLRPASQLPTVSSSTSLTQTLNFGPNGLWNPANISQLPSIPQSSYSAAGTADVAAVAASNNFSLPGNSVAGSTSSSYGYMSQIFNNNTTSGHGFILNNPAGVSTTITANPTAGPVIAPMPVASNVTTSRRKKAYTKKRSHNRKDPILERKRVHEDVNAIPKKPRGRPKKATTVTNGKNVTTQHAQDSSLRTKNIVLNTNPFPPGPSMPAHLKSLMHSVNQNYAIPPVATSTSAPLAAPVLPSTFISPTNANASPKARPTVTANIPMPPNWLKNCEDTVMSLNTFKKYAISHDTPEYQTISNMLHPIPVTEIEQIVNPDLWKRFVNTRTELFRSKTDDLNILSKLGLDEREVLRCAHLAMNYRKDPLVIPYSDNMVLLFHCTRSQTNLTNILNQGLDERLSNISGGLLGKGIYFADDPFKSMQYDGTGHILIFAVLLGDCISVDHFNNKNALVREPEKVAQQKRNFNDQFFDSIVARPAGHNEYVIYNRYQCCPIYQIKYNRSGVGISNAATKVFPPIAWIPKGSNYALPIQDQTTDWPFFAVDIFTAMGVTPPTDDNLEDEIINQELIETSTPKMTINDNLAQLINLGFNDEDKNKDILARFDNDLDRAVNYLLDNEIVADVVAIADIDLPSTSTATDASTLPPYQIMPSTSKGLGRSNSIVTIDLIDDESGCSDDEDIITLNDTESLILNSETDLPDEIAEWALEYDPKSLKKEMEDCPICCNDFESYKTSPSLWEQLQCSHKLCLACYAQILTSRDTMSGARHTFLKCPFCLGVTGIEVGTCPDMQMTVSTVVSSCEGYEPSSSIAVNYAGSNFNRTGYLPNNADGQEALRLLRIAFDRRLCFTIGTSNTTGQQNVVVWNIHHKTSLRGGVAKYGYPDNGYIDRLKWELKAFGIE